MRRFFIALTFPLLISTGGAADSTAVPVRRLDLPGRYLQEVARPATLEDAVSYILSACTADERQLFLSTAEDQLFKFHLGLGMGIRNRFGLWAGNQPLRDALGNIHPDDMSAVIIQKTWEKVRSDAGAEVVAKVDAIGRTLKSAVVANDHCHWSDDSARQQKVRRTTVGELTEAMNFAIEAFWRENSQAGFTRIKVEAVGLAQDEVRISCRRFQPLSNRLAPQSVAELLSQLEPPFGRYVVLYEHPAVRIYEYQPANQR